MKRPKKATRATRAAEKRKAAKPTKAPKPMTAAALANLLSSLPIPKPDEQHAALQAVAQAKGISLPSGFDLGSIFTLLSQHPELLSKIGPILELLPVLLALLKGSSAAGPAGTLPVPIPTPPVPTPAPIPAPTVPIGGSMNRKIVGLKAAFYHPQAGERKKDDKPDAKAHFNMADLEPSGPYITGEKQFNCFAEKCKCGVNATPLVQNADGSVVDLQQGDPENADVKIDFYTVIWDGVPYRGDAIQQTPVEVNGTDRNYGLVPICVFGDKLSGNHTLGFEIGANGFTARPQHELKLNG